MSVVEVRIVDLDNDVPKQIGFEIVEVVVLAIGGHSRPWNSALVETGWTARRELQERLVVENEFRPQRRRFQDSLWNRHTLLARLFNDELLGRALLQFVKQNLY